MMPVVGTPLHVNANWERSATFLVNRTSSRSGQVVAATLAPLFLLLQSILTILLPAAHKTRARLGL
jgi:hypothetical protein